MTTLPLSKPRWKGDSTKIIVSHEALEEKHQPLRDAILATIIFVSPSKRWRNRSRIDLEFSSPDNPDIKIWFPLTIDMIQDNDFPLIRYLNERLLAYLKSPAYARLLAEHQPAITPAD